MASTNPAAMVLSSRGASLGSIGGSTPAISMLSFRNRGARVLPYKWAFAQCVEANEASSTALATHPFAPSATTLFEQIAQRTIPSSELALALLEKALNGKEDNMVALVEAIAAIPQLEQDAELNTVLLKTLLKIGHFSDASRVVMARMQNDQDLNLELWQQLIHEFARSKLRQSELLNRLIDLDRFPHYKLSAATAASLLTFCGFTASGQPQLELAHNIFKRYLKLHQEASLHPMPFIAFTEVVIRSGGAIRMHMTHEKDGDKMGSLDGQASTASGKSGTLALNWKLIWAYFQTFNKQMGPGWVEQYPGEAERLGKNVLSIISRGASPWLCLNVARVCAKHRLMDGVEAALFFLHKMTRCQETEEVRHVVSKVFHWLVDDVKIQAHPQLQYQVTAACRVLIRFGMHKELSTLYTSVLDNVALMKSEHREKFISTMSDLVCPMCSSVLDEKNAFMVRTCRNCMHSVAAKSEGELASYQLSLEAVAKKKAKRKAEALLKSKQRKTEVKTFTQLVKQRHVIGASADARHKQRRATMLPFHVSAKNHDEHQAETEERLTESVLNFVGRKGKTDESQSSYLGSRRSSHTTRSDARTAADRFKEDILDAPLVPGIPMRTARGNTVRLDLPANQLNAEELAQLKSTGGVDARETLNIPTVLPPQSSEQQARADDGTLIQHAPPVDVPWLCAWCRGDNPVQADRVKCMSCGAETGPNASWRTFTYAAHGDVIGEIKGRIQNATSSSREAVSACYYLMVYRRAVLLRSDRELVQLMLELVSILVKNMDKVLAAYVLMKLVPPSQRVLTDGVRYLARLFGQYESSLLLTEDDLRHDETLFVKLFGAETCRFCFGAHVSAVCPIVTRDFDSMSDMKLALSDLDKAGMVVDQLRKVVGAYAKVGVEEPKPSVPEGVEAEATSTTDGIMTKSEEEKKDSPQAVFEAYKAFVLSAAREQFSIQYPTEANSLAQRLSKYGHFQRAAFVTAHIPIENRAKETYLSFVTYYGVTVEDASQLLSSTTSHLTIPQVTRSCCVCLDGQHASYTCPRLKEWLVTTLEAAQPTKTGGRPGAAPPVTKAKLLQLEQLRRQSEGWIQSGPERLQALFRFLLEKVDELNVVSRGNDIGTGGPAENIISTLNGCILKLANTGLISNALRLFARAPVPIVHRQTVAQLLKMNNVAEETIQEMLSAVTPISQWSAMALPSNCCLLCFQRHSESDKHSFDSCPELTKLNLGHWQRLLYITQQVGGIRVSNLGMVAVADYLHYVYQAGGFWGDTLSAFPTVARAVVKLVQRCYAQGMTQRGYKLMSRVPLHMLEDGPHRAFWQSAGLTDEQVSERVSKLHTLQKQYNLTPSINGGTFGDSVTADGEEGDDAQAGQRSGPAFVKETKPKQTTKKLTRDFIRTHYAIMEAGLCRHCFKGDHQMLDCELVREEAAFGRDMVAVFRVLMTSQSFTPAEVRTTLFKVCHFFLERHHHIPYHSQGVHQTVNGLSAIMSMLGEPAVALRVLLAIPAAYRMSHLFPHCLHALGIPAQECVDRLEGFLCTGNNEVSTRMGPEHLIHYRAPMGDYAMRDIFGSVPNIQTMLAGSDDTVLAGLFPAEGGEDEKVAVKKGKRTIHYVQNCSIQEMRESFDPIQRFVEDKVGMQLGSRHAIFSADVEVLEPQGGGKE